MAYDTDEKFGGASREIKNDTQLGAIAVLIAAFDALDEANGEKIGGPDETASHVLCVLEKSILETHAGTPDALAWKVRRLARYVANVIDTMTYSCLPLAQPPY